MPQRPAVVCTNRRRRPTTTCASWSPQPRISTLSWARLNCARSPECIRFLEGGSYWIASPGWLSTRLHLVDNQPGSVSNYRTGDSIQGKGGGSRVGGIVPGAIEAGLRTQGLARRDGPVIREVGNGDITPTLGIAAI